MSPVYTTRKKGQRHCEEHTQSTGGAKPLPSMHAAAYVHVCCLLQKAFDLHVLYPTTSVTGTGVTLANTKHMSPTLSPWDNETTHPLKRWSSVT